MIRAWLAAAALLGLCSVTAGALGAHLTGSDGAAELLRTAALYGLPHAAALVGLSAYIRERETTGRALAIAGWALALGALLFSLSLIFLGLTGIRAFGAVTPFGGAGLLIGWAALAAYTLNPPRCPRSPGGSREPPAPNHGNPRLTLRAPIHSLPRRRGRVGFEAGLSLPSMPPSMTERGLSSSGSAEGNSWLSWNKCATGPAVRISR